MSANATSFNATSFNTTSVNTTTASIPAFPTDLRFVYVCIQALEARVGVASAIYTFLLVLFAVTVRTFAAQYCGHDSFKLVLSMLGFTFFMSTIVFIMTAVNISVQIHPVSDAIESFFHCNDQPDPSYMRVPLAIQVLVGDMFTVYRTWLIFGKSKKIIAFPAFLCLLLLAWVFVSATEVGSTTYLVIIPTSFALNVVCSALIFAKLSRTHFKSVQDDWSLKRPLVQFGVSSGAIHSIVLLMLLVPIASGWANGLELVGPVVFTCAVAITLNLLILQLTLAKTYRSKGLVRVESPIDESGVTAVELHSDGVREKWTADPILDLVLGK